MPFPAAVTKWTSSSLDTAPTATSRLIRIPFCATSSGSPTVPRKRAAAAEGAISVKANRTQGSRRSASDFDPSGGASDFDPSGGASDFDPSGASTEATEQYGGLSKWDFRPPHPIEPGTVITEMELGPSPSASRATR